MKYILLLASLFIIDTAIAQHNVVIKVQNQSLTVDIKEDNSEKVLVINSKAKALKASKISIYNTNKAELRSWKRTFTIYDEADNEVISFSSPKQSVLYQKPITELLLELKKDKNYSLYTIAIPADPKRAAIVRVRRVLVCKIVVK